MQFFFIVIWRRTLRPGAAVVQRPLHWFPPWDRWEGGGAGGGGVSWDSYATYTNYERSGAALAVAVAVVACFLYGWGWGWWRVRNAAESSCVGWFPWTSVHCKFAISAECCAVALFQIGFRGSWLGIDAAGRWSRRRHRKSPRHGPTIFDQNAFWCSRQPVETSGRTEREKNACRWRGTGKHRKNISWLFPCTFWSGLKYWQFALVWEFFGLFLAMSFVKLPALTNLNGCTLRRQTATELFRWAGGKRVANCHYARHFITATAIKQKLRKIYINMAPAITQKLKTLPLPAPAF